MSLFLSLTLESFLWVWNARHVVVQKEIILSLSHELCLMTFLSIFGWIKDFDFEFLIMMHLAKDLVFLWFVDCLGHVCLWFSSNSINFCHHIFKRSSLVHFNSLKDCRCTLIISVWWCPQNCDGLLTDSAHSICIPENILLSYQTHQYFLLRCLICGYNFINGKGPFLSFISVLPLSPISHLYHSLFVLFFPGFGSYFTSFFAWLVISVYIKNALIFIFSGVTFFFFIISLIISGACLEPSHLESIAFGPHLSSSGKPSVCCKPALISGFIW